MRREGDIKDNILPSCSTPNKDVPSTVRWFVCSSPDILASKSESMKIFFAPGRFVVEVFVSIVDWEVCVMLAPQ